MKIVLVLIVLSLAGLVFLSACHTATKKRNEKVVTQNRPVSSFTSLSVDGVFPVELSQDGNAEFVKVEAPESIQENIRVTNTGSKLEIKLTEGVSTDNPKKLKVFVNIKNLKEMSYKSVGALNTRGQLKLDSLEFNSESVGKVNLDIDATFLRANLNSVGSTTLKGRAGEARINNKSVGMLSAFDLKANTLMIHNTAIGVAEVYADSAFYIRSSAIGMLTYKGPGVVKELNSEGLGKVKKAE